MRTPNKSISILSSPGADFKAMSIGSGYSYFWCQYVTLDADTPLWCHSSGFGTLIHSVMAHTGTASCRLYLVRSKSLKLEYWCVFLTPILQKEIFCKKGYGEARVVRYRQAERERWSETETQLHTQMVKRWDKHTQTYGVIRYTRCKPTFIKAHTHAVTSKVNWIQLNKEAQGGGTWEHQ